VTEYLAGRAQMGTSLGFHIVFASLGVGLPLLLLVVEGISLRSKDPGWRLLARRWSRAFGILFAVGAVSGTVLSFELGLLWPGFMGYAGGIIGLPFSMEGFAFFLEAIFLGLYLYGWDRLSPMFHWLCTIPLALSGGASAWFVTTANAWMNSPTGFRLDNGRVTDVHPLQAIFNPGMVPNINANPRGRKFAKRGRKRLFNADIFKERFDTIERVFGWEDKFRRLLLRFERLSQLHYAFKTLAYTMINLRHFC